MTGTTPPDVTSARSGQAGRHAGPPEVPPGRPRRRGRADRAGTDDGAGPSRRRIPLPVLLLVLLALLLLTAAWALTLGQADISVARLGASAAHHLCAGVGLGGCPADPLTRVQDAIVWQGRAPAWWPPPPPVPGSRWPAPSCRP